MKFQYKTKGTCSQYMIFDITEDDKIASCEIIGGCSGNTQGVSKLVKGRSVDEVISLLDGIKCGYKSTSCPDQLANALKLYKNHEI